MFGQGHKVCHVRKTGRSILRCVLLGGLLDMVIIGEPFHVTHVDGCLDLIESEFTHHQKCRAYSQVFSSEEQDGFKKKHVQK